VIVPLSDTGPSRYNEWRRYADSKTDVAASIREKQARMRQGVETLVREA